MTLSRSGDALRVKNTIPSSGMALLSEKTPLNGDFSASLEVYGGKTLGLVSSNLRDVKLEVKLAKGWQRIRVDRQDGKIVFLINGRQVTPQKGSRWIPTIPQNLGGFFFVSLGSGQECRLRNFELRADLEAADENALDDWWKKLRGDGDDDDGRRGRGRSGRNDS